MPNSLVHPNLLTHLAQHHFPNFVSIQVHTITYDSANEPVETWVTDPLLVGLSAYIEPMDNKVEVRREDQTIIVNGWNISLAGFYPTIKETDQVTDELSRIHNILGVDFDAFHTQTNLTTEIINA
jgi:hypothetical protein